MNADTRTPPAQVADERTTLTGFLQYQRETLAMKCAGLTTEQLRDQAVPPSEISLLGLVRHLAWVERSWFRNVLNGEQSQNRWRRADGTFGDFDVAEAEPAEVFASWQEECANSRAIVAAAESLDVLGHHREESFALRYILAHMIEEYARHNGHADLLRERINGVTGE